MIRYIFLISIVSLLVSSCSSSPPHLGIGGQSSSDTGFLYATGISDTDKIRLALDRKKEYRNIRKGDYMTLKNNPEQAITYYQQALEKIPNDIVIRRKIAHVYYQMRNWKDAYLNYSQVPTGELKDYEYSELFSSLFLDDGRHDRLTELAKYTLDRPIRDYYQTLDVCYEGVHNCVITLEAYIGTAQRIIDLQNTIKKSTQISPDYQYRNFLLATQLYTQGAYQATEIITREILEKRPNYTEVRKLRGFTLYELGRYSEARDILLAYIESNPKDVESLIRLGEIYTSLGDYTTSSLYLNNVITAGYPHKTEIERRLAYNYAALRDHTAMLNVLSYLLQERDVTEDDYAVAISMALEQGENIKAYSWSYTAKSKYPNSAIITPLYLSALRLNGRSEEMNAYIHTLPDELASHPLIELEYAVSLLDMNRIPEAIGLLRKIRDRDPQMDWGMEAARLLAPLEANLEQTGSIR